MSNGTLPSYLKSTTPNPTSNRSAWFKNTAQTYAGIFLWIAFFDQLGGTADGPGALGMTTLGIGLLALVCAAAVSVVLFYLVPGLLGMKTGLPLYIVGTSTFGTKGGYFLPGIFMGLLQIGWYSVGTFYAAKLILMGVGMNEHAVTIFGPEGQFSVVFVIAAIVWGYAFAFLGAKGIQYVASVSTFFPLGIIALLVIGAVAAAPHLGDFDREKGAAAAAAAATVIEADAEAAKQAVDPEALADVEVAESFTGWTAAMPLAGFLLLIQMVVGFFATAGAVGADFCLNNRDKRDVWLGGIFGIGVPTLLAGGLALVTVAGAQGYLLANVGEESVTWGKLLSYSYGDSLQVVAPGLGNWMLILFAIGSMAPACFCSFIIGNSLSTMLGSEKTRVPLTLGGATIGIILAALGVAGNLAPFFGLIGASFGPVIGAMAADYLLSGRRWAGPRDGISVPGYAAWVLGFIVGILNHGWVGVLPGWQITGVYSLVVGFVVYFVLAKAGMEPAKVDAPHLQSAVE